MRVITVWILVLIFVTAPKAGLRGASLLVKPEADSVTILAEGPRPGTNFALVFDTDHAGIRALYDIDADPEMKTNLAAVGQGSGYALFQDQAEIRLGERKVSITPAPARTMQLVENFPERVVLLFTGSLTAPEGHSASQEFTQQIESVTGRTVLPADLPGYELRYTVYPTGTVYVQLVWVVGNLPLEVVSHHVLLANAPTDQFLALNDWSRDRRAYEWPASFVLHHGLGPRYRGDVLLTPHFSRHETDWLGQVLVGLDGKSGWFRSAFRLTRESQTFRRGRFSWEFLLHVRPHTQGQREAALDLSEDYRHPDTLRMDHEAGGTLDIHAPGDSNFDSYCERDGAYGLLTGTAGVRFTLSGKDYPRFYPAFCVTDWKRPLPESVRLDGVRLTLLRDYNAFVLEDRLFVQYLGVIADRHAYFEFLPPGRQ